MASSNGQNGNGHGNGNGAAESVTKSKIQEYLSITLPECCLPELGEQKTGKVRDIYFSGENVVMVTNDRVSAFDFILPNLIPFKGQVLNNISEYTMAQTADVLPNALVKNMDGGVVVQKKMKNLNVEWIVRGYLWGSMAAAYEKGDREFCGIKLEEGLNRFQKLSTPLFTPTSKAEVGHDENMTYEEIEKLLGKDLAAQARDAALRLFERGVEVMRKRGLILIDTKYEFGVDEQGKLHVIDEVNTPDSSRMCDIEEWEGKYPKIEAEMKTGQYKNVTELLQKKPELKLKEFSKQYVRDALLDMGFNPQKDQSAPKLSDEQVVECAYRYIKVYERITGMTFRFPDSKMPPAKRIIQNLQNEGMLVGGLVVVLQSKDAQDSKASLESKLSKLDVPCQVCPLQGDDEASVQSALAPYLASVQPVVVVSLAGSGAQSQAVSTLALKACRHPVLRCDASQSDSAAATAGMAARILAPACPKIAAALSSALAAQ
mmetsp:Transcript_46924/g.111711  ORF Transcript_46924/g.111711 Transcript_46924/m.111711 type:complete len:488 (+) Transcript_46924:93-1556(+)|eukprot:CAMPEP_0178411824 /NCGR_PEP_ID=MMETSP0689_2-20121128/21694_1 /TAXON_ID=160604 /ORGANISM="Amphidinium massartii, Strain CS-259" /LENGTH=487 /DNA_ID=CAMNT_0020033043 /DNA_START=86 /DNA_END=1549 /DNA_ORIENTATION=-